MNTQTQEILSKVPAVTLVFWIVKIFVTTLGETAGDALSMKGCAKSPLNPFSEYGEWKCSYSASFAFA